MDSKNNIDSYIQQITDQVRWKRAHKEIAAELKQHIEDCRLAYIAQGVDESSATEKAIEDTGDAVLIGTGFDKVYRPQPQWHMLGLVALLLLVGAVVNIVLFYPNMDPGDMLLGKGIGLVVMGAAYFTDFTLIGKYPKIFYGITLLLVVFGTNILQLFFSWSLGRSMFNITLEFLFPLVFAGIVYSFRGRGYKGMAMCVCAFGAIIAAGVLVTDISVASGALLRSTAVVSIVFITAILKNWFDGCVKKLPAIFFFWGLPLFGLIFLLSRSPRVFNRILAVFSPWSDPLGSGFSTLVVRDIISNGSLIGAAGQSEVFPFLNDPDVIIWFVDYFLLAAIILRFGWLAFMVVCGILVLFIALAIQRCFKQKNSLGFFVSLTIFLIFAGQVVMYIVFNLGLSIATAPLPLISRGIIAHIVNLGLIGIMLSVFRTGNIMKEEIS